VGSDFGAWLAGTTLLADPTLAAVSEFLVLRPSGVPAVAARAYDGEGLGPSGARWPEINLVGSGYFLSQNVLASHESGNFSAYTRGSL